MEAGCEPITAIKVLMEVAEREKVAKWIEFPDSIFVFVMIPGDANSGRIYLPKVHFGRLAERNKALRRARYWGELDGLLMAA